jgi:hypothetical protein
MATRHDPDSAKTAHCPPAAPRAIVRAMRWALLLAALAVPAAAETPLSGAAFDALTRGQTFTYAEDGVPYGAEEYRDDREVVWSFLDGECLHGRWYEAGDAICFVYEDLEGPRCWEFFDEGRLRARFLGGGADLIELDRSEEPLECLGPNVGV